MFFANSQMLLNDGRALVMVALALGVVAVGCGSAGSTGAQTSSLTKAQFLKRANAICAKGIDEISAAYKKFYREHPGGYGAQAKAQAETGLDREATELVVPIQKKEIRGIRALGLPGGSERYVDKMLALWEEGIEQTEEGTAPVYEGRAETPMHRAYSMGIDYGIGKCWLG
jgi:hypothetical protein